MEPIKKLAKRVVDTSDFNVHELKAKIKKIADRSAHNRISMKINLLSFGFKYGIPTDADLVIDMRFLANPFFVPELKALDGRSKEVREFILETSQAKNFLKKYLNLLEYLIPLYTLEGKAYLTIAVGCTGGRHRSVAIANAIYEHLGQRDFEPRIIHRDIDRDTKES
jgi:UPF0042 nucleotide-binding protein